MLAQLLHEQGRALTASAYQRFDAVMQTWNVTNWTAHEVTTSDDYILTTFHVPANPSVPQLGSILFQHGTAEDGARWMSYSGDSEKPFHLVLADEGYDVWIGNNRGTEYSQGHNFLDAAGETAEDYWNFTWAEMSRDVKANVSEIKRLSGEDKIYYIGYSQGTTQMNYAIAHDNQGWYQDNLRRVIHLAPCFVAQLDSGLPGWASAVYNKLLARGAYNRSIGTFIDNGIYAINGPNA